MRKADRVLLGVTVAALCLWATAAAANAVIDLGARIHDLRCPEHGTLASADT